MITIPNWMFLSSYKGIRTPIVNKLFLESLIHNGRGVWGSDFGSCSFVVRKRRGLNELGVFKRLFEKPGSVASNEELEKRFFTVRTYYINPSVFSQIPGSQYHTMLVVKQGKSAKNLNH